MVIAPERMDSATPEAEVRLLCEEAKLSVEDIAHTAGGRMIVTIKPVRTSPARLNAQFFRLMHQLETRWYAITHLGLFGESFSQLSFTPLSQSQQPE